MRLLILGGTAWLGRHVAEAALAAGHQVTCLARGSSGPAPDGAALLKADRDAGDAYMPVQTSTWDAVVDVSRQPGQVHRAAQALAGSCGHFVFVSSISVYADHSQPGQDESAPLLPALEADVMADMSVYGSAKVACERHVVDTVGTTRSLIVRPGLIGGPGDTTDRTGYWPLRFARAATRRDRCCCPTRRKPRRSWSTCATSHSGSCTRPHTASPAPSTPPAKRCRSSS